MLQLLSILYLKECICNIISHVVKFGFKIDFLKMQFSRTRRHKKNLIATLNRIFKASSLTLKMKE